MPIEILLPKDQSEKFHVISRKIPNHTSLCQREAFLSDFDEDDFGNSAVGGKGFGDELSICLATCLPNTQSRAADF